MAHSVDKMRLAQEVQYSFVASSGPGGQNVNKSATKVLLRWHVASSQALSSAAREMLFRSTLIRRKLNDAGELMLTSQETRSQDENRSRVWGRLCALLVEALTPPRRRVPTKPTRGSRERRLRTKKERGRTKSERAWRDD
jgi:ribosome-associated protein